MVGAYLFYHKGLKETSASSRKHLGTLLREWKYFCWKEGILRSITNNHY